MKMLCAGLQWLGGTEEALDTCKLLNGTWRDHYGSLYDVRATLISVHVVTTRPNGKLISTNGLIRIGNDGSARWTKFTLVAHSREHIEWAGPTSYEWTKLQ